MIQEAMFIRIKEDAHRYIFGSSQNSLELVKFLKENAGKLVQVDTNHLFNNQYNTDKFRLFDSQISEVINDARPGRGKCNYCGTMLEHSDVICLKHGECPEYGINWYTEKNTYFIKYPQGYKVEADKEVKGRRIGSYNLELIIKKDCFRISNQRRSYTFNYDKNSKRFIIYDTIGNKMVKYLPDVPMYVYDKLYKYMDQMLKESNQIAGKHVNI